jgi:hypothetical protein
MKIVLYTRDLRLRASPRHGGQGVFFEFLVTDPPHRKPRLGRRHSSYLMDRVVTIHALYLNNTTFIGNAQYQTKTLNKGFTPTVSCSPEKCDDS